MTRTIRTHIRRSPGVALLVVGLVAACSSSDDAAPPATTDASDETVDETVDEATDEGSPDPPTTQATQDAEPPVATEATSPATTERAGSAEPAGPIVVTDAFGNDVEVPASPQRVFAGDDTSLANLLELGVRPVGTAVNDNAVPDFLGEQLDGIVDVSADNGFGVNFEAMAALEPDLIIGPGTPLLQVQYGLASEVAPTYAYRYGYASSDEIRTNLTDIARLFGLEGRADEIIADLDARVADLGARLQASERADDTVSVIRIFRDRSGISLRHGTTESVLMAEIGIRRPPNQRSIEDFATELSLETLELADADTIYVYLDDPDDPAVYEEMLDNPLWQTLEAVRDDRVFLVDGGIWNGVSIAAANLILDDLEATLGL